MGQIKNIKLHIVTDIKKNSHSNNKEQTPYLLSYQHGCTNISILRHCIHSVFDNICWDATVQITAWFLEDDDHPGRILGFADLCVCSHSNEQLREHEFRSKLSVEVVPGSDNVLAVGNVCMWHGSPSVRHHMFHVLLCGPLLCEQPVHFKVCCCCSTC